MVIKEPWIIHRLLIDLPKGSLSLSTRHVDMTNRGTQGLGTRKTIPKVCFDLFLKFRLQFIVSYPKVTTELGEKRRRGVRVSGGSKGPRWK